MKTEYELDLSKNNGKANASMILGCIAIIASIIPILGVSASIAGIITGVFGLKSEKRNRAKIGITLSIIFLLVSIGFAIYGAMVYMKNPNAIKF